MHRRPACEDRVFKARQSLGGENLIHIRTLLYRSGYGLECATVSGHLQCSRAFDGLAVLYQQLLLSFVARFGETGNWIADFSLAGIRKLPTSACL
jgi:hypothetical protein